MALIQLDLFGWVSQQSEHTACERSTDCEITISDLANAFIQYFGSWIGRHQNLLEDDTTICEDLIIIRNRFTRRQLRHIYKTDVWFAAWKRFNEYYLTSRTRGNACFSEGWTFYVTMPDLIQFKKQALGKIRNDEKLEFVWEEDRDLCVYGYDGFLFLVATPEEFGRLQKWYKPYWYDIQEPSVTIDGVQLLIFGVDDYENIIPRGRV